MKYLKIACCLVVMAFVFTSCTNDEPVNVESAAQESTSITKSLNALSSKLNSDGTLNSTENPANNIIFDFCFDFVYPLELSYNTGAVVTVNDFNELIDVIISSTEELYIDGISFPFDVEVYNEETGTIEVQTINNEEEFVALLEGCDFDVVDPCECTDDYDPVCVEIEDIDGTTFVITYPNACVAECDGFTEDDFVENCEDDSNCDVNGCFTLDFPLDIITDEGETITINSQEEFDIAVYSMNSFNFVYPISVTMENGDTATINNEEELSALLEDCFGDLGNCNDCGVDGPEVCVEVTNPNEEPFTITFPNACIAECEGFTSDDFVDCN